MAFKKDPDATLDYTFDWTAYLALQADSIVDVEWVLSPGLTLVSDIPTGPTPAVFVSGGVLDETESITCRITTSGGRIDDRTAFIAITQR